MKCSKCGFENSDNSKFCINCASSLSNSTNKICPACKYENPNIAKFCQNCATDLTLNASFLQNTSIFSNNNSTREEELRRELERLRLREQIYPEKKKSNKLKWIVLSLAIFLVVSSMIGGLFVLSYYNTQSRNYSGVSTQKSVQQASEDALGGGLQIISIADDGEKYYASIKNTQNSGSININGVSINPGGTASISSNSNPLGPGTTGTFTVSPTFSLSTGKTRTFTISGYSSSGRQSVIVVTYTDS